ncbi:hypothetical protein ACKQTC_07005 [Peptococcus simiae]|uniref:Uncharacterized protein n=1 Tax=Peptococcus simiae TaxID=1643805 RepID=A0ABW9H125_9FIRM
MERFCWYDYSIEAQKINGSCAFLGVKSQNIDKNVLKTDGKSKNDAKEVVVTDLIDPALDFAGSVTVDGKGHSDFSYDEEARLLTVNLGDVKIDQTKKVVFKVTVNKTGYGKEVENIASATAKNTGEVTAQANSGIVKIKDGSAELLIEKEADKQAAKVGDKLIYTLKVANSKNAEVDAQNAVVKDTLPKGLSFDGMVTKDGAGTSYKYDPATKAMEFPLGDLKVGEEVTLKVYTVVNEEAYGKDIENVATVTADNATEKKATSKITTVDKGKADGRTGTKTPSKTLVKPGERMTYTITLTNSPSATADWENVTITDPIPAGMIFKDAVEVNGKRTNEYSFDAATNTLTLKPDPIAPGAKQIYTIDVEIAEGMEGKTFTNIAYLTDDITPKEPVPSVPVNVPDGKTKPLMKKEASVKETKEGQVYTYTVTVENGSGKDVATWRNVTLTDLLPGEIALSGMVLVDGNPSPVQVTSNNSFTAVLGDIEPGTHKTVKYDVRVKDDITKGQEKTLTNIATAAGDNGMAKDKADVKLGKGKGVPELPSTPPSDKGVLLSKDPEKAHVDLTDDPYNTYTVTLQNKDNKDWKGIRLKDKIDTSYVVLLRDSIRMNGLSLKEGKDFSYVVGDNGVDTLDIKVGDVAVNGTVKVTFKVKHKNDTAGTPYVNTVKAESTSHKPVEANAASVTTVNPKEVTDNHQKLFSGYPNGEWWPDNNAPGKFLSRPEAAAVILRSYSNSDKMDQWIGNARNIKIDQGFPEGFTAKGLQGMDLPIKIMMQNELMGPTFADPFAFSGDTPRNSDMVEFYETTPRIKVTRKEIGDIIKVVLGPEALAKGIAAGYDYNSTDPNVETSRRDFAKEICTITGRDTNPDINGNRIPTFTDVNPSDLLIAEVSIWHQFTLDENGHEKWTKVNPNAGVKP